LLWEKNIASCMFVWAFSRLFSASQRCFSRTANQPTILSAVYFQPNEHAINNRCTYVRWYFIFQKNVRWNSEKIED
jgi:hypothetical protein